MTDQATLVTADRPRRPRDLRDWLLSHGRHWLTLQEGADLLGLPIEQAPVAMLRARRRGELFEPTRGAYVPIPPEFRYWGAVPASHFVDPLMRHLGAPYYVGLLSAAEIHGVVHQHPQVFQVVTDRRLRARQLGRVRLDFVLSAAAERRPTVLVPTPTGTMRVSTPEVTALDLVLYPRQSGGLSNVATTLGEMLEERLLNADSLASAARLYPASVRQRTGWLLEDGTRRLGISFDLAPLHGVARERREPTPLSYGAGRSGQLDERWNVIVNRDIEPDL